MSSKPWWMLLLALFQCSPYVQQNTPENTMNSLFRLAEVGDLGSLGLLCDPKAQNDGDTDCICALADDYTPHQCERNSPNRISAKEFKTCFNRGQLRNEVRYIQNNIAEVDFRLMSLTCPLDETMTLVKRENKWYLLSF